MMGIKTCYLGDEMREFNKEGLKRDRRRLNEGKLNRKEEIKRKKRKGIKGNKERETNRKENGRNAKRKNRQNRPKRNALHSEVLIRNKHVSIHLPQCELNKCRISEETQLRSQTKEQSPSLYLLTPFLSSISRKSSLLLVSVRTCVCLETA
jgi:hypothetical protein